MDSSENAESWDIYASMMGGIPNAEIDELSMYWDAFPELRDLLFAGDGTPYSSVKVENVKKEIENSADIERFRKKFTDSFADFDDVLRNKLITGMETVQVSKEEAMIGDDIFARLADVPLVDKYAAYQILDDNWNTIAMDFDVILTEGKDAVRGVDPNMVVKKDKEVQDGWKGRILPFDLVQKELLRDELAQITEKSVVSMIYHQSMRS